MPGIGASALFDYTSPPAAGGTVAAAIALPSDYNGTIVNSRRVWIALVGQADLAGGKTTPNNSGVYRITGSGATANIGVITPFGSDLMGSLDYNGSFLAGTLVAGRYGHVAGVGANIYRTTNPGVAFTAVLWYGATRPPTGNFTAIANAFTIKNAVPIAMDKNFTTSKLIVCGTLGTDSAFAISNDGSAAVWNEAGLIDNAGLAVAVSSITPSPKFATDKTIFLLTNDYSGSAFNTSLWKTTNGGATWLRLMVGTFAVAGRGIVALSPTFDTDQTLYVGDKGGLNVFYSTNGGKSWSARPIPAGIGTTSIGAMAASDTNTLYVADGGSGNVAKTRNAGWVWSPANVKATGSCGHLVSLVAKGTSVVVGDDASSLFRSDDAGATWTKVGPIDIN